MLGGSRIVIDVCVIVHNVFTVHDFVVTIIVVVQVVLVEEVIVGATLLRYNIR